MYTDSTPAGHQSCGEDKFKLERRRAALESQSGRPDERCALGKGSQAQGLFGAKQLWSSEWLEMIWKSADVTVPLLSKSHQ